MSVQYPYLSHLRYILCFIMQPFDYPIKPGSDLPTVNLITGSKLSKVKYLCSGFIRLDFADLVELLDACAWLDEPLYDLYFFDA